MLLFSLLCSAAFAITPTVVTSDIEIDGHLSEDVWIQAKQVGRTFTYEPVQGIESDQVKTRFLVDDEAIYVGIEVTGLPPDSLNAPFVPRDETIGNDWVGVMFDTYQDRQRAFVFRSNPRGV